jgi:hypothetical protein
MGAIASLGVVKQSHADAIHGPTGRVADLVDGCGRQRTQGAAREEISNFYEDAVGCHQRDAACGPRRSQGPSACVKGIAPVEQRNEVRRVDKDR